MNKPIRNHRHMIYQSGKWVESLATYHNHWRETWQEFVDSLSTVESVIERVREVKEFDDEESAQYCYQQSEKAAVRNEKIRAAGRDNFQLRSLVESAHSCYIWNAAGDYFSGLAAAKAAAAEEAIAAGKSLVAEGEGVFFTASRPVVEYVAGEPVYGLWQLHSADLLTDAVGVRRFGTSSELAAALRCVCPIGQWKAFNASH